MVKKVLFAADFRNPEKDATSTQIMNANILKGFCSVSDECILLAMVTNQSDCEIIRNYYKSFADEIYFVPRITGKNNNIADLLAMVKGCISVRFDGERQLAELIDEDTYLVSQSPTIDAALLCKNLMKYKKPKRYIQYWCDPIALSLQTPEQFSFKRRVFYAIEHRLHRFADNIVYGTKSLFEAQKMLFAGTSDVNRMSYCDVAYIDREPMNLHTEDGLVFGYIGNYYSNIRDLQPLYRVFQSFTDNKRLIICGESDLSLTSTENTTVMNRVPQSEVHRIERMVNVEICLLNRVGIQIPGKVFYEANTDKLIIVIVDGPWGEQMRNYLFEFRRFVFCDNTEDSIRQVLCGIDNSKIAVDKSQVYRLSPEYVARSILNGGYSEENAEKR